MGSLRPTGPAGELLRILAMASERYPILDNFNVFDRFNIPEHERPARRQEFREKMRDEVRRRLGEHPSTLTTFQLSTASGAAQLQSPESSRARALRDSIAGGVAWRGHRLWRDQS